jgi:propionyl-CoA carboxylase alpha chain
MIKTLLIANRGEIACRVMKTAKRMGINTVAVYSEADTNSLHVKLADKAIYIGASAATQSYLNQKALFNAIEISGADAVHPGYGFLSENFDFVELLQKHNIAFVGPSSSAVKAMGDKIEAKKIATKAGVSVVPGVLADIKSVKEALKIAKKLGYPIMLKAAAGGGGKGMRIVRTEEEMQQAFSSTKNEARNNFSDARTFIEKFIENPRHIEIQIIADKHGNVVCLGERECSIQRHNQKVIEEAPSPFLDDKTRKKMYSQCVSLAKKVGYSSAGTVEFIVDQNKNFYFLEMNTRLQVEHAVTEMVTGLDIVELMIRVANGEKLPFSQKDIELKGWAFESRIYAEDPSAGFLPSTGQITTYIEPERSESVRIDTGVYEGGEVSMFYDAMISKLITYAPTRGEAIEKMNNSLAKYVIRGISHNISFLQAIYNHPRFIAGDLNTKFINQEWPSGFSGAELNDEQSAVILATAIYAGLTRLKREATISGQVRSYSQFLGTRWVVTLDDKPFPVTVRPLANGYKIAFESHKLMITSNWVLGSKLFECVINDQNYHLQLESNDDGYDCTYIGSKVKTTLMTPRAAELKKFMQKVDDKRDQTYLKAPISGVIADIKVKEGDAVSKGQTLYILEAMKMENIFVAAIDGVVKKVYFQKKANVMMNDLVIELKRDE